MKIDKFLIKYHIEQDLKTDENYDGIQLMKLFENDSSHKT